MIFFDNNQINYIFRDNIYHMNKSFKIVSNNISDTEKIAASLVRMLKISGGLVCMYGDIGAGKTALTSLCAKFLGVKEKVTSPSFVILNEYHSGDLDLYHFDLYRLENEGLKSIIDELQTYSTMKHSLTFVEWAEFSAGELDLPRLEISIKYIDDNSREFLFTNYGILPQENFETLKKELLNEYTGV